MMNFTLLRGEWRRGADRVSPNTVRALHARGVCRLWVPITPETADALGWGPKATAREWHRFRFEGRDLNGRWFTPFYDTRGIAGRCLHVPVDAMRSEAPDDAVVFRLYPRIPRPAHYEVVGAAPRKGTPSGWCWEGRPRVGAPAIIEERDGVEVRHEMRGDLCKAPTCCPESVAAQALHERIGKDLAAIDPAAWQKTPRG